MTTSETVLDYNEPVHLLKKQQEYLMAPEPGSRNHDKQVTSKTVLGLIEAFRRSKAMFAAVELGIFDGKLPADYSKHVHLLKKQQEYSTRLSPAVAIAIREALPQPFLTRLKRSATPKRCSPRLNQAFLVSADCKKLSMLEKQQAPGAQRI